MPAFPPFGVFVPPPHDHHVSVSGRCGREVTGQLQRNSLGGTVHSIEPHQVFPFVTDQPHHRHFRQSISRPGPPGDIVTQSSAPPKSDMPLVKVWAMALPGVSDKWHLGQTMGFFRVVSRPTTSSSGLVTPSFLPLRSHRTPHSHQKP